MNANDLLDIIGEVRDQHLLSAVRSRTPKQRRFRKPLLVAALIALVLVLAGCAAAVLLRIQDMKIDTASHTSRFNEYGKPTPTEVQDLVIALHGHSDNPVHRAAEEWYDYTRSLPDDLWMENNRNEKGLPENYYLTYECYTREMADKLDAIAAKYSLKLLGAPTLVQRWQNRVMLDALGIDGVCSGPADYFSGIFYPNGNFQIYADLSGDEWALPVDVSCRFYYTRNDYFDPAYHSIAENSQQWNYTAGDGTELLLVMGKMGGYIFADRGDAFISILVSGLYPDIILREGDVPFSREMMEQIANAFDYRIRPQAVDMATVQPKLDAAEAEHQAQLPVYEEPVYHSYGEYLNSRQWLDALFYALADLDRDGTEELLLGDGDGAFHTICTIRDGQVRCLELDGSCRLCENGSIAIHLGSPESGHEQYIFGTWDGQYDITTETELEHSRDGWGKGPFPVEAISEAQAQAILDRYLPAETDYRSVLSYPMDENGTPLAQIIREQDPILTEQDIVRLYADMIPTHRSIYPLKFYALRDINGDGVIDLLLSDNTDTVCEGYTVNRGRLCGLLFSRVFLCEDNILETNAPFFRPELGGEWDNHSYSKLEGRQPRSLSKVLHCITEGTWQLGDDGPFITEAEAEAVISQYRRIDPGMKPLRELVYGK